MKNQLQTDIFVAFVKSLHKCSINQLVEYLDQLYFCALEDLRMTICNEFLL